MSASNKSGRLDHFDITIEGTEDLAIQPWHGPLRLQKTPISGDAAKSSREAFDFLVVSDEDLTVRPWPRAQAAPAPTNEKTAQDVRCESGEADGVSEHSRKPG